MARRQKARPQCLRSHPRGVRGETEGADRGDESGAGGVEAAEKVGNPPERDSSKMIPSEKMEKLIWRSVSAPPR